MSLTRRVRHDHPWLASQRTGKRWGLAGRRAQVQVNLMRRRQDFKRGNREWQEHPDHTFARPTSWGPERYWIYQVLQPEIADAEHGQSGTERPQMASTVLSMARDLTRVAFVTQETTVNMSSFGPALESAFARAGIPRRSETPRQWQNVFASARDGQPAGISQQP